MKKVLTIFVVVLAFCFGLSLGGAINVQPVNAQQPATQCSMPAFNNQNNSKKKFASAEAETKQRDTTQQIKVLFNNKTFLLNLKKYEINSPVHTTKLAEQKFKRHGTLNEKVAEMQKLIDQGLSVKQALNLVCINIDSDVQNILKSANIEPVDATIKYNKNTKNFNFTKERAGYKISEDNLYQEIFNALKIGNESVRLNLTKLNPTYTENMLKQATTLRGKFSTNYAQSTPERKHNIKKALSCFNGLTLLPGQTISFNTTTGARTEKNGYKEAKVILNGAYTEGIGGGVCQASTTLYNACLVSDVGVLNSSPHSLPASYVNPGFDAMVSFGASDLTIKNTTKNAITFVCEFSDTTCSVKVYGSKLNYTIELVNEVTKEYNELPAQTISAKEKGVTPNTVVRPAFKGFEVQTYALYKKDDQIIKTQKIRLSRYKSQSEQIAV